jgi:hypothetical protein
VIYGPGGTPIYQINTTGEVQYLHQDHQGSTRLTTNANGTTRNTITYNAHGEITANTNWWLEQPSTDTPANTTTQKPATST